MLNNFEWNTQNTHTLFPNATFQHLDLNFLEISIAKVNCASILLSMEESFWLTVKFAIFAFTVAAACSDR